MLTANDSTMTIRREYKASRVEELEMCKKFVPVDRGVGVADLYPWTKLACVMEGSEGVAASMGNGDFLHAVYPALSPSSVVGRGRCG